MLVRIMTTIFALASAPAHAEIHKCHQGERVIYQEAPCPEASVSLAPPLPPPPLNAHEVKAAHTRAGRDIAAAEALRRREEIAARVLEKKRAAAQKQELACERLLDRIEVTREREKLSKTQKITLGSERRKYRRECGPL